MVSTGFCIVECRKPGASQTLPDAAAKLVSGQKMQVTNSTAQVPLEYKFQHCMNHREQGSTARDGVLCCTESYKRQEEERALAFWSHTRFMFMLQSPVDLINLPRRVKAPFCTVTVNKPNYFSGTMNSIFASNTKTAVTPMVMFDFILISHE